MSNRSKYGLFSTCDTPLGTMKIHLCSGTKQQMDTLRTRTEAIEKRISEERADRGEAPDQYPITYTIEEINK